MDNEQSNAPVADGGNAPTAPDQGNPEAAPAVQGDGHAEAQLTREQVQSSPFFKELQADHTRKAQALKEATSGREESQKQIQQLQQALNDPMQYIPEEQVRQYMRLRGYNLSKLEQDDYSGDNTQAIQEANLFRQIQPLQQKINDLEKQNQDILAQQVTSELNANFPDWTKYEDEIKNLVQNYPGLARSGPEGIKKLYNLAVPEEVKQARMLEQLQQEMRTKQDLSNTVQSATSNVKAEVPDEDTAGDWEKSWDKAMRMHGLKT